MKEDTQNKLQPGVMSALGEKMRGLETALLANDPDMPSYLKESHKLLVSYPESVHLLDDSEIRILIQAAEKHTQVQIIAEIAKKSKAGSRTKAKDVDIDDL